MRISLLLFSVVLAITCSNTFAAAIGSDSVLNPSLSVPASSQTTANSGTTNGDVITANSYNEYQYGTCPAGFTYNGSSQFPLQVRTVTQLFSNGYYTGTTYSGWYDMDADCQTTEYQQVACPTNYTGVYYQSRQVTTGDAGYEYGAWNTYANSCVYNPPPPPDPAQSCIQAIPVLPDSNGHSAQSVFDTYYAPNKVVSGGTTTYNNYVSNGKDCGTAIITTCSVNNATGVASVNTVYQFLGACNQGGR